MTLGNSWLSPPKPLSIILQTTSWFWSILELSSCPKPSDIAFWTGILLQYPHGRRPLCQRHQRLHGGRSRDYDDDSSTILAAPLSVARPKTPWSLSQQLVPPIAKRNKTLPQFVSGNFDQSAWRDPLIPGITARHATTPSISYIRHCSMLSVRAWEQEVLRTRQGEVSLSLFAKK